jgi:hypothetical protein
MTHLPTSPLWKSVWRRATVTLSYSLFCDCVAVVLVLFPICCVGRAQDCPGPCPPDSKCISGICREHPSSGRHSGPCTEGNDCPSGKCVNHVCSLVSQRCIQDSDCASRNCVDRICSDSRRLCLSDSDCPSGTCSAGNCIKKPKPGASKLTAGSFCSSNSQCQSGRCVLETCSSTIPKRADGSSCARGSQCASGTCSLRKCIPAKYK